MLQEAWAHDFKLSAKYLSGTLAKTIGTLAERVNDFGEYKQASNLLRGLKLGMEHKGMFEKDKSHGVQIVVNLNLGFDENKDTKKDIVVVDEQN
jgi:hypothetical protein